MSMSGLVAAFVGALIICLRAPLVFAPATALRWLGDAFKTEGRTRAFGAVATLIAIPAIWCGVYETSELANVMFILGIFFASVTTLALVVFPSFYMSLVDWFLPEDLSASLFGWRILGLVGVAIGVWILTIGLRAL